MDSHTEYRVGDYITTDHDDASDLAYEYGKQIERRRISVGPWIVYNLNKNCKGCGGVTHSETYHDYGV